MNPKENGQPRPTLPVAASVPGLAVAVVAISRYLAARDPSFGIHLARTLESAEAAGLADEDFRLLRLLIASAGPRP